jgi:hypothetical protein
MAWKEELRTYLERITLWAVGFVLAGSLSGCALSHGVRPVGEKKIALDASLGGPIADYMGGKKPFPLTMVGATYGLTDTTNVHAGLYPSSMIMFGLFGMEVGASHLLVDQHKGVPAVMVDGTLIALAGNMSDGAPDGGFRPFLQTSVMASWAYGRKNHLIYTGPDFLTQPMPIQSVPGWTVGHRLNAGRWGVGVELGWLAPFWDNLPPVVEYAGIAGRGALTFNMGVSVLLGGEQ